MPLFSNRYVSPQIFINQTGSTKENNQEKFHLNFFQEVLTEQQRLNTEITGSVFQFENTLQQTRREQSHNFTEIVSVLARQEDLSEKVIENMSEQKQSTGLIDEKLDQLEQMQKDLVKSFSNEELINQTILDQLAFQQSMIQELTRNFLEYEKVIKAIALQAEKQEEIHNMLTQQADLQGVFHQTIMEHLGKQDVVSETITSQLNEIRTTLSTKVTIVLEKIEEQYLKITKFFLGIVKPDLTQKKMIKSKAVKQNTKSSSIGE